MKKLILAFYASLLFLVACDSASNTLENAPANNTAQVQNTVNEFDTIDFNNNTEPAFSEEILPPSNEPVTYTYAYQDAPPSGFGVTLKKLEFHNFKFTRPTTKQLETFFTNLGLGNIEITEDGLISGECYIPIKNGEFVYLQLTINRLLKHRHVDSNNMLFFIASIYKINAQGEEEELYFLQNIYNSPQKPTSLYIDHKGYIIKQGNTLHEKKSF